MTDTRSLARKTRHSVLVASAALLLSGCDAIWTVSGDVRDVGRSALPAVFASTLLLAGWSIRQLFLRHASKTIAIIAVALAAMALSLAAILTGGFSLPPGALGRGDAPTVCTAVAPVLAAGISISALLRASTQGESSVARGLGYLAVGMIPAVAYGALLGVLLHRALLPHTPPAVIAFGRAHACAIEPDGSVVSWGVRERPHFVAGLSGGKSIAAEEPWRCAVTGAGRVACWFDRETIQTLEGIDDAVEVALGTENLCVRRASGEVDCRRMPGMGPQDHKLTGALTPIPDLRASQIVSARALTCAVRTSGKVACWGRGEKSVLGADESQAPLDIPGIDDAAQVALGEGFACVKTSGGGVSCWGSSPVIRRLGRSDDTPRPAPFGGLSDVTSIAAGPGSMCVITHGAVDCWGYMTLDGRAADSTDRWPVANLRSGAVRLFSGPDETCAAREDGSLWCLGRDDVDLLRGEHSRNCSNDNLHLTVAPCVGTPQPLLVDD